MTKRTTVGVRYLKDHLSATLERVRQGETVVVTDHQEPVAMLVRVPSQRPEELLRLLAKTGRIAWSGGKPRGLARSPRVRGSSVAAAVVEDRR